MTVAHWHDHHERRLLPMAGRWVFAGILILVLHVAAVYAGLHWHQPEVLSEPPAAAVMIDLSDVPVAPPSESEEVAPGPQMVQAPEPVPDAPDTPDESVPPPLPEVVEQPVEKMPDLPPPPPMAEAVLPAPRPVVQEPPPPEQKKPDEKKPEKKASRRPAAKVTTAAPKSDAPKADALAAPSSGASASRSNAPAEWKSILMSHLNRNKRYPTDARNRHEEGVSRLRFTIDRSGRVVSASLAGSSGFSSLDNEALETVRRASPFPAPPPEAAGATITIVVPLNFSLR